MQVGRGEEQVGEIFLDRVPDELKQNLVSRDALPIVQKILTELRRAVCDVDRHSYLSRRLNKFLQA